MSVNEKITKAVKEATELILKRNKLADSWLKAVVSMEDYRTAHEMYDSVRGPSQPERIFTRFQRSFRDNGLVASVSKMRPRISEGALAKTDAKTKEAYIKAYTEQQTVALKVGNALAVLNAARLKPVLTKDNEGDYQPVRMDSI